MAEPVAPSTSPDYVRRLVHRLTVLHESERTEPWAVTDAPERYVAGQLRAIVGVEMVIDGFEAKAKLSQNRSAADVAGVVAGLTAEGGAGGTAVADQMRQVAGSDPLNGSKLPT